MKILLFSEYLKTDLFSAAFRIFSRIDHVIQEKNNGYVTKLMTTLSNLGRTMNCGSESFSLNMVSKFPLTLNISSNILITYTSTYSSYKYFFFPSYMIQLRCSCCHTLQIQKSVICLRYIFSAHAPLQIFNTSTFSIFIIIALRKKN